MLADKKVIDWKLGYAMTIHTIGCVEYLNQLIWVEAPPLPPEIAQKIEETKKKDIDYILTLKCIQEDKCAS
ncbi:10325_t:CDS:2, partial [Dentiscutata heterogama]